MTTFIVDLIVLELLALVTIATAAFGIRQEWRAGNRPSFAFADVGAILAAIAVAGIFVVTTPTEPADAHYTGSKCADTSPYNVSTNNLRKCRRVARVIHRFWKNDANAHAAQRIFSCESGLDRWSRINDSSTQYRMIPSFSRAWRDRYKNRLSWRVVDQMWVAHDIWKDHGWGPWGAGQSWGCA